MRGSTNASNSGLHLDQSLKQSVTLENFTLQSTLAIMNQCIAYNPAAKKATFLIRLNDLYKSMSSTYSSGRQVRPQKRRVLLQCPSNH